MNKYDLNSLEAEIINLIVQGYTTNDILTKLSLRKYHLIKEYYNILNRFKNFLETNTYQNILTEYINNCSFLDLQTAKIIFISDTHFGSKYENLTYFDQVKDFLKQKKDIKYLIHGGDIGDGMVKYASDYNDYKKQIDHILEVNSEILGIKQYFLGGNHDRRYLEKGIDILGSLEEINKEITGIGYYQSYIKLADKLISLEHNSHLNKIFVSRYFSILGHSHKLTYKESSVFLPTLCDDSLNRNIPASPGFIVLESKKQKNHLTLHITNYLSTENGIEKGKVKTYKLK